MITSLQNQRIKHVVKLYRRRYREQQQEMVIEGYRQILRAVTHAYPLDTLYYCPDLFLGENEDALIQQAVDMGATAIEVSEAPFRKMATRQRPEGLLATAPQVHRPLSDHVPIPQGFYIVAEGIEKAGNLGTIIRSADGAGVDAVIVCDTWVDLFHPDVIRASVGTFFTVLILESTTLDALTWCRTHQVRTLAATPYADVLYSDVDMHGTIAVAVGTEQYGLSDAWMTQADTRVRLPMCGEADSLNVAMAATLLMYEAIRQRGCPS